MGRAQIKISVKKIGFVLASLLAALVFAGQSYAALPYFKASGGDVSAGGWFNNGQAGCSTNINFQAPTYSSWDSTINKGGIMAFVNGSFNAGASSQLGAFSLGIISKAVNGTNQYGFLSGFSGSGGNSLSFANDQGSAGTANYYAGIFENAQKNANASHQATHCIPDYYSLKTATGTTNFGGSLACPAPADACKLKASGNQTIGSTSILPSKNISLFVDGNVIINGPITYATPYDDTNVPKLAIVARGNIYIDPSVTQLDGLYIAQPKIDGSVGNIWTCNDGSTDAPTGDWLYGHCNNTLTLNGALIARQVQLTRIQGDVSSTPAETFNYTPEMVVGGGFFNPNKNFGRIESLVNLPPVF